MSGFISTGGTDTGPQATLGYTASGLTSDLMQLLNAQDIQPGAPPSYQLCKTIYASHPMGKKMVDAPIDMAQSQKREITIPGSPEERLVDAYERTWANIGGLGADMWIAYAVRVARIYGVGVLAVGIRGQDSSTPIPRDKLYELQGDLYFSVFDPLNTAGALVLEQDPNNPNFQKPTTVRVNGKAWHPANTLVQFNEQPLYIEWSDSAFGFSGRSVYQRALYMLKSYIQTMITNDLVSYKAGVIVAKRKVPTSNTNNRMMQAYQWVMSLVRTASVGNVINVDPEGDITSIDMTNLEAPFRLARENIIKDLATAADMPARVLDQETLSGNTLADGTEDAKNIARWVERFRTTINPLYSFMDDIVQRIAWSPAFFKDLQAEGFYKGVSYTAAFQQWRNAFTATWPNLLIEPESERLAGEEMRFKSAVALYEVMAPQLDDENKTQLTEWIVDEMNARKDLFSAEMQFDPDALKKWLEERKQQMAAQTPEPTPFSYET
ncbi:anti-CBASS protein Acb1 family protein [Acidiphilium sp.]|uniref:anti-CBASS protein Acb1 family protein n=1 Tax=Acidiphilium sp. TaxID=527 RepID=UPI002C7862F6|nr:anti-CBASS Acb1 family protein [Acidiphilium sp.]HQT62171.1 DUF1073 domain-containing protein [Acidiphilium sp.]